MTTHTRLDAANWFSEPIISEQIQLIIVSQRMAPPIIPDKSIPSAVPILQNDLKLAFLLNPKLRSVGS